MNAGCGDIQIFSEQSKDGMSVMNEMGNSENVVKKALASKWNAHINAEDSE